MNKRNKSVLVLVYSLFLIVLFIINVNGNRIGKINSIVPKTSALGDIEYNFQENILYNETNPNSNFGYNTRNQTVFTNIYNGTYSFTNEISGIKNEVIDFVDLITNSTDCYAEILSDYSEYDKVLRLYDYDSVTTISITNLFIGQVSGSFDFWLRTSDSNKQWQMLTKDEADIGWGLNFLIQNGKFRYYDGSYHDIISCTSNSWYHLRFDFETSSGAYLGLNADKFYVSINGIQYGAYSFDNLDDFGQLILLGLSTHTDYIVYIDAIGYSWDNDYDINDNIIPYNYKNNTLEIDKWGFFNNEDGSSTSNGQGTIPFWNEVGTNAYISKNINEAEDETCVSVPVGSTTHEGLYRDFNKAVGNFRTVSFRLLFTESRPGGSVKCYTYLDIDSYDDTLICRIRIDDDLVRGDLKLNYYNGSSYIELKDLENLSGHYILNITITKQMVRLNLFNVGNSESNLYYFPIIVVDKVGLGDVKIESYLDNYNPGGFFLGIDSIGVYIDGVSQSNDFANYYYYTGDTFNNKVYNFINLNASGYFGLSMNSFAMSPQTFTYFNYQNNSNIYFKNILSESEKNVVNSYLTITTNTSYNLNHILIYGIKLSEGINDYYPSYETSGIDVDLSYFYVINNELRYILRANDSNLEYMLITFDIDNLVTYNKTFTYTSQRNSVLLSELRLGYTDDTTTIIDITYGYRSEKMSLPINKELDYFQILVTDNDMYDNKNGTGYFISFILRGSATYEMDINTLNLLEALSPLLFFIIFPSLLIAYFLKQSPKDDLSKKVLIPLLMVFSLIAFGFGSIPLWSLFLIIIAFASLFLITNDEGIV